MKKSQLAYSIVVFVYAFLYLPLIFLVLFSFNASSLVTVWGGFSTKWYQALLENHALLLAAFTSLKVALASATLAVIGGTLIALVLSRFGPFKGRFLLRGMVTASLVMPEVITGLALLLLFIALEQAIGIPNGRSIHTITIAHATLGMSYVVAIVYPRLANFDDTLIEAAQDLGATPFKAFFLVTLPLIAPSLLVGWILAFVLSLDDVVLASFTSGPGATTLPMAIFSSVRLGVTPQVNALATVIISIVALIILIGGILMYRQGKTRF